MLCRIRPLIALVAFLFVVPAFAQDDDPLPSWNDGATKQAIIDFVTKVSEPESGDYVPPKDRIATFDNDGTLWLEQPMYVQLAFALDRVKELAPEHPEWKKTQPFKAALEGDMKALAASGEKGVAELVMATHAGMTPAEFQTIVGDWLATAKDKRFERGYTGLVYQPMLELLAYLRAERLHHLHRVRRRHRVRAQLLASRLRHSAGAGRRLQHQDQIRGHRRRADGHALGRDELHRRQGRQAHRHQPSISASGPSRRSATPTAIIRCWTGRPRATGRASA